MLKLLVVALLSAAAPVCAQKGIHANLTTGAMASSDGISRAQDSMWVVYWDWSGRHRYVGQDEMDARAKFYSLNDGATKFIANNNAIVIRGAKKSDDSNVIFRGIVGYAVIQSDLPIPSTSTYDVVYDQSGDHVASFDNALDAGEKYGTLEKSKMSSAVIYQGAILEQSFDDSNYYLWRALGWYYLCTGDKLDCSGP